MSKSFELELSLQKSFFCVWRVCEKTSKSQAILAVPLEKMDTDDIELLGIKNIKPLPVGTAKRLPIGAIVYPAALIQGVLGLPRLTTGSYESGGRLRLVKYHWIAEDGTLGPELEKKDFELPVASATGKGVCLLLDPYFDGMFLNYMDNGI